MSSRCESRRSLFNRQDCTASRCPGREQSTVSETSSASSSPSSSSSSSSASLSSRSASTDHPDYALKQPRSSKPGGYDPNAITMSMKLNTGPSRINSRKSAGAEQATTRVSYSSPSRSTSSKHRPSSSAYHPSSHRGGNPRISSTSSNHPTRDSCSPSRPTSSHRRSAPNPPASYAPARQETSGNVANGNWPAKFSPKKEQTQASGNMGPATVQQTPTAPYYPPKSPFAQKSGTCPDKHRSLLDIPRRYQLIILFFVIVLIITFYFALLGMVIENNKLEEFNFKMLQQIVERFERSNQSQLRNM